jgi:hypothetical protein
LFNKLTGYKEKTGGFGEIERNFAKLLDKQRGECYNENNHSAGERRWCIMKKKALTGR